MARPFEFTAWTKFQDQPFAHPGKLYDRADNEPVSGCPVGGPAPYGRIMVRGPQNALPGVPTQNLSARYYTKIDAVCLPDLPGTRLMTNEATPRTFAAAGLALPLDDAGLLIPVGVGVWTEYGSFAQPKLAQPFGLGDIFYQDPNSGQVSMATQGHVVVYCETDINVGDVLYFRHTLTAAQMTNGVSLLGAVSTGAGADKQLLKEAKVFRPGPAGGACVLTLDF